MLKKRPASARGHANHGWLDTYHTFSFGNYYDPEQQGFRALRVINEDRVQPGHGFGEHPHRNMEIITCVLEGELEHKDSMGNGSVIRSGEFQRISAGTGITHSEFNPSETNATHLYQIWLLPEKTGLTPSYEQRAFPLDGKENGLRLVVSPDGAADSISVNQDTAIYSGKLSMPASIALPLNEQRFGWIQMIAGTLRIGDIEVAAGDGIAIGEMQDPLVETTSAAEFLFFDLA